MYSSGVTDLTGKVLAGRYRLTAPIGTGASGRVYMADDVRLKRRVAVKVLHAALAEDQGFLRRFRAEAQVAASLNHPNIMTVHDWGEDGVPFMVLELLLGGSLRALLDQQEKLSVSQSATIGRGVSRALRYAHARGLVHRDIKPANLLFDEDGEVRVADFGLARALAEASWTEPTGTVLGTVRYAAPEQAMGVPLDARADLYSLALVMAEMVTGRVPHAAETLLGTLAIRSDKGIHAVPAMGILGPVLERAGHPRPQDRYPAAAAMERELNAVLTEMEAPETLPLVGIRELVDPDPTHIPGKSGELKRYKAFEVDLDVVAAGGSAGGVAMRGADARIVAADVSDLPRDARLGGASDTASPGVDVAGDLDGSTPGGVDQEGAADGHVGASDAAAAEVGGLGAEHVQTSTGKGAMERAKADTAPETERDSAAANPHGGTSVASAMASLSTRTKRIVGRRHKDAGGTSEDSDLDSAASLATERQPEPQPQPDTSLDGRKRVMLGTAAAVVAFLATAGIIAITLMLLKPNNVEVPSLEGLNAEQAAAKAEEEGLEVNRVEQPSLDAPPGTVIGQTPAPGAFTNSGSEIKVVVSSGPPMAPVPAIVGLASGPASEALSEAKLEVVVADRVYSASVPKGSVVSVDPPVGTEVAEGEAVQLVVSDGPEPVDIPAVAGKSESEAVIAMDNIGVETTITREFSDTVASGVVVRVSADGETVVPGDTVTLVVSKGPDLVTVPLFEGQTQTEAEGAAEGVVDLEVNTSRGRNFVWRQDPAAGTQVKRGTLVTIFL